MFSRTDIYLCDVPGLGGVRLDPLGLRRRLLVATSGRCWEWAKQAKEFERKLKEAGDAEGEKPDAERAEFSTRLAELEGHLAGAAYEAFGVSPVSTDPDEPGGVTEVAVLELLYGYLDWLESKKNSGET